jgi:hypothetical protein
VLPCWRNMAPHAETGNCMQWHCKTENRHRHANERQSLRIDCSSATAPLTLPATECSPPCKHITKHYKITILARGGDRACCQASEHMSAHMSGSTSFSRSGAYHTPLGAGLIVMRVFAVQKSTSGQISKGSLVDSQIARGDVSNLQPVLFVKSRVSTQHENCLAPYQPWV